MSLKDIASSFANKLTLHGEVQKLTMKAYQTITFDESEKDKPTFSVPFNPTTLNLKLQVGRVETTAIGASTPSISYTNIPAQDFNFEFIIDGTGFEGTDISILEAKKKKQDEGYVVKKIAEFLKVVYKYEGNIHQPNYVKIVYGAIKINCVLYSVDITYNLFHKSGKPLRAKINASFKTAGDKALGDIIANAQSPDLTHIRELKQHDHFLNMSNKMYDDNLLYVQVARANNMNSIRENKTGKRIVFPPIIEKENSSI
jgi:hypothetical protein